TITRTDSSSPSSRTRYGRQLSRSEGSGRLAGGAQRTAAQIHAPVRRSPSSRATDVGWFAKPTRNSEANSQSPERSPVKIRPVRLPPCAAGARPSSRTRACGSPNPATDGPSTPRKRTPPASRARPLPATRPGAGSAGRRRPRARVRAGRRRSSLQRPPVVPLVVVAVLPAADRGPPPLVLAVPVHGPLQPLFKTYLCPP